MRESWRQGAGSVVGAPSIRWAGAMVALGEKRSAAASPESEPVLRESPDDSSCYITSAVAPRWAASASSGAEPRCAVGSRYRSLRAMACGRMRAPHHRRGERAAARTVWLTHLG